MVADHPRIRTGEDSADRTGWPAAAAVLVFGLLGAGLLARGPAEHEAPIPVAAQPAHPPSVPPVLAPPVTAPPVTAPPVTAPPVTAPPVTAPSVTAPSVTAPSVTAPLPPAVRPAPAPTAAMPAPPATTPALASLARLFLDYDGTVWRATGRLPDEATLHRVTETLNGAFGTSAVRTDLVIDPAAGPAPWMGWFGQTLPALRLPGLRALFQPGQLRIGGSLPDAERDRAIATLRAQLPDSLRIAPLPDATGLRVEDATAASMRALAVLPGSFSPAMLVQALNISIVNFPTAGAEIPPESLPLIREAATRLRQLPPGTVIEVSGHTDNTGDPEINRTLSQRRAEAVRAALVAGGAPADQLVAKGYGSGQPVADNATEDGRFRNRRIEYRVGG
ncbi:OmpA family protein [Roseomonas mucosa]|uniref:OmpA family protein n=1 Tax=Roseomonas mucosa TaxID=207340 RepID=UPI001239A096|nr:OmpA family protein [Roseomonas mucosa]QET92052.1 OmpA family protein [Roseomonas mucosa]